MIKYLIQKYRHSTSSGSKLAEALNLRIYTPSIRPKRKEVKAINWGLTNIPWRSDDFLINKTSAVLNSSNKLRTFELLDSKEIPIPLWCTDIETARTLFDSDDKEKVVCRTLLSSSSGNGIVIAKSPDEVVPAPLYTLYIKKKIELRVHVVAGRVIYIQQKRRLTTEQLEARGITNRCKYIRNLSNGYIFSGDVEPLDSTTESLVYIYSLASIESLGLDFGAVDLIITGDYQVYVLEVNSAPGLEGTTLSKYISEIKEVYHV